MTRKDQPHLLPKAYPLSMMTLRMQARRCQFQRASISLTKGQKSCTHGETVFWTHSTGCAMISRPKPHIVHLRSAKCTIHNLVSKALIDVLELGKQRSKLDYSLNMKRRKRTNAKKVSLR